MRLVCGFAILGLSLGLLTLAVAQPPRDRPGDTPKAADKANSPAVKNIVDRLMAFDKNKDGKISKDEITDQRLRRLFERADADKDGVVTKEELTALATRMVEEAGAGGQQGGFGPPGGGPGGPGGRGPGGFGPPGGGPGGRGPGGFGPPALGQILPPFLQENLKLSAEQKKQLDELQKEVDAKLGKILTAEQKQQLKQMRERFGRGGPPGGRGPGGPPPGDGNGPPPPPR
jgi:hypothetical protein